MSTRKLLSIICPVYNEAGNIEPLYNAVVADLQPLADRYDLEFVFTDNRSEDATFAELVVLADRDPRVRVFRLSRNFGFQRSILTGYQQCRGDAAVQIDCDLQDPPALILEFVKAWEDGFSIVYGQRVKRQEGPFITFARKVFYRLIDVLSEDELPHDAGDFRLVDRQVLDEVKTLTDHSPYLRGTLATMGFDQKGIPYARSARTHGESKFGLRALAALALDGVLSHSTVPLRLATWAGIGVSLVTLIGLVFYLVGKVVFGANWPAGFATTTVLILISLCLNSLFLGIIGEYVGRIFHQVRNRPVSIIETRVDRAPPHPGTATTDPPDPPA